MTKGTNKFSDAAIRQFLLGILDSKQQSRFEQALFTNASLEARVRLAEIELSDDYIAANLSAPERDLFRQRFLLTTERKRTLQVSLALHDNFAAPVLATRVSVIQRIVGTFDVHRNVWRYALATLIIGILFAVGLLLKKEYPHIARPLFPRALAPRPTATATPQVMHHSDNSTAPAHTEPLPALPAHDGLTTSVTLNPNTALDRSPVISAGNVVTIQLKLDEPLAEFYEVNVMTMAGQSVLSANATKRTQDQIVSFDVPTSAIKSGDFQIALTRVEGDSKQTSGIYYFRVR